MVCGNLKEWVIHIISIFNDDKKKEEDIYSLNL